MIAYPPGLNYQKNEHLKRGYTQYTDNLGVYLNTQWDKYETCYISSSKLFQQEQIGSITGSQITSLIKNDPHVSAEIICGIRPPISDDNKNKYLKDWYKEQKIKQILSMNQYVPPMKETGISV